MPDSTDAHQEQDTSLTPKNSEDHPLPQSDCPFPATDDSTSDEQPVIQDPPKSEEEQKLEDKKVRSESYKILANVGNFGLFLLLAVFFSYFIGSWLDKLFNTSPVFTIFWIVCGVIASFRELYASVKRAQKLGEDIHEETHQ